MMKYLLKLSLAALLALFIYSCSNELDVIEASGDIPVVYGFLSLTKDTQYIRVERAFIDKDISAFDLAQNLDSLYYKQDVIVSVRNMTSGVAFTLDRVDASSTGYIREEGIFLTDPNILYQITSAELNLDPEAEYQLEIVRPNEETVVTALTNLVGECRIVRPLPSSTPRVIDFSPIAPTAFRWRTGDNAHIYDIALEINYQERLIGGENEVKQLVWPMATNINDSGENVQEHLQDADGFFNFLANNIEENPQIARTLIDFRIKITAGSDDLEEYLRIGQANLGITSTQDIPVYTNLSEGRGLFASTYETIMDNIVLSPGSQDSLFNGSKTMNLNFN